MYKKSKLKNGINLITVPVAGTKATTVLAMFPVGSRYETKKLNGASHFVEHMLFKGTQKRPAAIDISRDLEAAGADYNAFTNKDYTGYYVKIDGKKQEIAYDILSDMIYNSKIVASEVKKEKGAIVEELRMRNDNPLMAIDALFEMVLFGKNHPLGWDVGGSEKTVRLVSRRELWQYYHQHYSPKNMVLVVAGDVEKKKLKKLVSYFGSQKAPGKAHPLAFYKNKGLKKLVWPLKHPPLVSGLA
jgi:predicted Zn-dependent peptidase